MRLPCDGLRGHHWAKGKLLDSIPGVTASGAPPSRPHACPHACPHPSSPHACPLCSGSWCCCSHSALTPRTGRSECEVRAIVLLESQHRARCTLWRGQTYQPLMQLCGWSEHHLQHKLNSVLLPLTTCRGDQTSFCEYLGRDTP